MADEIPLLTAGLPDDRVVLCDLVCVSHVEATNLLRDVREMITNLLGGEMRRYGALLDKALARAEERMRAELAARGYDGAICVRIAHPLVTQGGAEVVMYGTGFRWRAGAPPEAP